MCACRQRSAEGSPASLGGCQRVVWLSDDAGREGSLQSCGNFVLPPLEPLHGSSAQPLSAECAASGDQGIAVRVCAYRSMRLGARVIGVLINDLRGR